MENKQNCNPSQGSGKGSGHKEAFDKNIGKTKTMISSNTGKAADIKIYLTDGLHKSFLKILKCYHEVKRMEGPTRTNSANSRHTSSWGQDHARDAGRYLVKIA